MVRIMMAPFTVISDSESACPHLARNVCFVSDVAAFIKNQNVWDSDLSVRLTTSTCGFEDPMAT